MDDCSRHAACPGNTNRRALRVGSLVLFCLASLAAAAQPASGRFEVRSAYAQSRAGVYYVNAIVDYTLSEAAVQALQSGVPLTLEVQVAINRARRYWPDKNVATIRQRYQLEYHALSQRYVVRNLNSGEQDSYATLAAAVRRLGAISDLPLIDAALLEPDKRYEIRLRAVLDIRSFPGPLRLLAAFFDEWRLESDWYTWPLRH